MCFFWNRNAAYYVGMRNGMSDVCYCDVLVAHLRRQLHAPPAAAQGHRHGALGVVLADDVAVEFVDDFAGGQFGHGCAGIRDWGWGTWKSGGAAGRSEEHTSELQSLMRISYAVFCLKQKKTESQHI